MKMRGMLLLALYMSACNAFPSEAASSPALSFESRLDAAVNAVLVRSGVPSASIAIVRHRAVAYTHAYGVADLTKHRVATPAMRYAVGSISKEFTAAAILLLQERKALSLDDAAGRWLPDLGPAAEVTLRELLSHTAGVRDYWPQDYDFPDSLKPVKPLEIVRRWGEKPLDFAPGSAWQYSNTGYTMSGLIAERASGVPLFEFLRAQIFQPLGMTSVFDFDAGRLPKDDAVGYTRFALSAPHPAAKEGRGWLFAVGPLAMTAADLARWDIALLERRVLNEESYRDLTTAVQLTNGVSANYALGLEVLLDSGRRVWKHGGAVGGFTAENRIYPDDDAALVVQVNQDNTEASAAIADELTKIILSEEDSVGHASDVEVQEIFTGLRHGHVDAARLTGNARSYFTAEALRDYASTLGPLGDLRSFTLTRSRHRGGLIIRDYRAEFKETILDVVIEFEPGGLIEQYIVSAQ